MKNKEIRSAVILCGGKGTRLGTLGSKIPKSLVKINSVPILYYIIKILVIYKFNHFILPIGYKGKIIRNYIKNNKYLKKLNIEIIDTGKNTNISKRIFKIKRNIISKNFLLLNGDAIFDFDILRIFEKHLKSKSEMTFICCESELAFGTVGVLNGKVKNFNRNINYNAVIQKNKNSLISYVYSGMAIMNKNLLKGNFKNYDNFEKKLYPRIINKNKCNFENIKGFWHSIDNVKDISALSNQENKNKYKLILKIKRKIK
tara:strand:- start:666 stop:1439 length:774 start_codon:yes stop_codon:yes gene_type:complete